jgi:hypothetical protein
MNSFQVLGDCAPRSILPVEKDVDHSQRKFVLSSAGVGTLSLLSTEHNSHREKCLAVEQTFQWDPTTAVANLQTSFYH